MMILKKSKLNYAMKGSKMSAQIYKAVYQGVKIEKNPEEIQNFIDICDQQIWKL